MDHDQRFKTLIHEFLPDFFRLFFPDWADRFDFARVEWLESEVFPDPPDGRRRALDLVAKLPTVQAVGADQWLALIHVEIEARDSVASLRPRMFDYYHGLRSRYDLPVLPIGLFLKVGLDGLGWDAYEEWFWERRVLHFEFAYVGLPALDAVQYLERDNWLGVALAALMRVSDEQRALLKVQALDRLARCPENDQRRFLLCEVVEAYLPLEGPHLVEYEALLQSEKYLGARQMIQTSFEKGQAQGMAQGISQGISQGRSAGQRDLLLQLLVDRFGAVGTVVEQRLAKWPDDRLAELGRAVIKARSLRDLGLED